MKTLTLLRHAKSDWTDTVARDFDRPLNGKGKRAAALIGRHLRSVSPDLDHVVASPAIRVVETLAEVQRGFGRTLSPDWDRRIYLASAMTLMDVVRDLPEAVTDVLLVGHNPGLEDLVLLLVPATAGALRAAVADKYPTASVARLTFAGEGWADVAVGGGTLEAFVRPRDLDATLGPGEH